MELSEKPVVSIVIPGYNEEAIVTENLEVYYRYMSELEVKYEWEIIFINDGSTDNTGSLADEFALRHPRIRIVHHIVNSNLGDALKTGFANATGDYTITMDLDMSYAPWHIEKLVETLVSNQAEVVVASPFMKGGKVTAVPLLRNVLSRGVNLFMKIAAQQKYHTFTGMVRGYRTDYIRSLNLKSKDYEINPEILYKSMILRARIVEIPAHLDWTGQNKFKGKRTSNKKILESVSSSLMSGFMFRPYIFFLGTGIFLLLVALYLIVWIFINVFNAIPEVLSSTEIYGDRFSEAIAIVYQLRPYSFFVGGITFIVSLIFLAIGFLSLQKKRYFEELFHLNTAIYRRLEKFR